MGVVTKGNSEIITAPGVCSPNYIISIHEPAHHKVQLQRKSHISDWPIKRKRLRWAKEPTLDRGTLPRRPASRGRLFTVDVETVFLRVLFNEAAS